MPRLTKMLSSLRTQPGYTLMRGVARFDPVRAGVAASRRVWHGQRTHRHLSACEARMAESPFSGIDRESFVRRLQEDGIAHGLQLPLADVAKIRAWAEGETCYADRHPRHGFVLGARAQAEAVLGKPILLAQYFNAAQGCPAIARLIDDAALQWIAARYLGSLPAFVGANLWWTFPVRALESDRAEHAHLFHRDVDDFRFFKFFFYLTDVPVGEGAHVCVAASHREPPLLRPGDRWIIRRYGDDEIASVYAPQRVQEICGPAGTGFAENTLCIHKGSTPVSEARLLLQLQFALFDYGAMNDQRAPDALASIV